MTAAPMIEFWRGGMLESFHAGHAVVFGPDGIEAAWGDPEAVIFPRSSVKMIQALPLVESGAADAAGLSDRQLAFACASHSGAALHRDAAAEWLAGIGMHEEDLRCGTHMPWDTTEKTRLVCSHKSPCQLHNNCSGKHVGFLTLNRHLRGGSEYVEVTHPLQQTIKTVFEEVTDVTSPGFGIDGCSAPNFATTVTGLARAMQLFAAANPEGSTRERAAARLTQAMATFPEMVANDGRACTELMRAMGGKVAVKTGAEAVYIAILPEQKRGIALKIVDGATRASEAAITALLIRQGVLDRNHPTVETWLTGAQKNWRGIVTGEIRLAPGFG
ncbi:MAG: asparaginase [Rhodobacteraceae bacterium]|nr:asparaginase [Paracoccaceae bacterium]